MKRQWHIFDFIDLEYFMDLDRQADPAALKQRDREIYQAVVVPAASKDPETETDRSLIIRLWLEAMREAYQKDSDPKLLPARLTVQIYRLLVRIMIVSGLIMGGSAAFTLLWYTGEQPVNVTVYLGFFVVLQLMLLFMLPFYFMARKMSKPSSRESFDLYRLTGSFMVSLVSRFKKGLVRRVSTEKQMQFQSAMGLLKARSSIYSSLFFWPFFILIQLFGLMFNISAICATTFRIITTDIAFGWQSTLQISADTLYTIVKILAWPWSRLISPDRAFPSLSEIEGSRIILKEGIYDLATRDLVSWWPFIGLAVICYGLIPRAVFYFGGLWAQKRAVSKFSFQYLAADQLLLRLKTPVVSTRGDDRTERDDKFQIRMQHKEPDKKVPEAEVQVVSGRKALVLVPEDIMDQCGRSDLDLHLMQRFGLKADRIEQVSLNFSQDRPKLEPSAIKIRKDHPPAVVFLQEAWQSPIREHVRFIRDLRDLFGNSAPIYIALIGKPAASTIFTPAKEKDIKIWESSFSTLGDPNLLIRSMVDDD